MRPLNWGPKPFLQSSACWFLSLFLHLALRFLNQTLETGGEGGRGETRVSQEPPPPPPQPFASSRGNSRPCPYIHTHTHTHTYIVQNVYVRTHTQVCLLAQGTPRWAGAATCCRGCRASPGPRGRWGLARQIRAVPFPAQTPPHPPASFAML